MILSQEVSAVFQALVVYFLTSHVVLAKLHILARERKTDFESRVLLSFLPRPQASIPFLITWISCRHLKLSLSTIKWLVFTL